MDQNANIFSAQIRFSSLTIHFYFIFIEYLTIFSKFTLLFLLTHTYMETDKK